MLRQDRQVVHRGVAGLTPEQLAFRGETSPATSRRHLAWRGVSPDPEMQIDPIGLELDESTSLLAVVFAPGLHGQHPTSRGSHCSAVSRSRTVIHRE